MFSLDASAMARLGVESVMTAEAFLSALPPYVKSQVRRVRLFGTHAREFDCESEFQLLVEVDKRSIEVRTALAVASSAVDEQGLVNVSTTLVTPFELANASGLLARTIQSAEREGLDLWVRVDGERREN